MPDHPPLQHDRVRAPLEEPLVLAHLAQAEREKPHGVLGREPVRQLDVKRIRGAVAVPVEQRLEELRRHRPELDRAQSQAESRRGSRSSSEARVSSSSFSKRSEKSARTLATCVFRASSSFFVPSGVSTA